MGPSRSIGHAATNLLAFLVKAVGLVAAGNQLLVQPHPTTAALAVSAFMVGGAQVSQSLIIAVLDRLMGPEHHAQEADQPGTGS